MSDSFITKKAIAAALKRLCLEKPFDKISVSDITSSCGLNRQTFYYHFQDKYELLSWIYYTENFSRTAENITFENWDKKLMDMLAVMERDRGFYMNTLKDQEKTFESYLLEMVKAVFEEAFHALDEDGQIRSEERQFYAEFYAYGLTGVIITWAKTGMKLPADKLAKRLKSLAVDSERMACVKAAGWPDRS